jgi:hypothetical protein
VVDSTDRERLSITKEELHRMLESDELCKAALLVFANKQVILLPGRRGGGGEGVIGTFLTYILPFTVE